MSSVSILHISDLHLTVAGDEEAADLKVNDPALRKHLLGRESSAFLDRLTGALSQLPGRESAFPRMVVVTGDLVETGGVTPGEMEAAAAFLERLAARLHLDNRRILVVPGNHDVNWSSGLDIRARFDNFQRAMSPFTTPRFEMDGPVPHLEIATFTDDIAVEVLLLVSPTFSGVPNPDVNQVFERIHRVLYDWPQEQIDRLRAALSKADGQLDIAAIGAKQIEFIRNMRAGSEGNSPIRIAALHHHLLPDPQLDVAAFESVLDAGRTLHELLYRNFDLVLTGHKHNRRLAHYGLREHGTRMMERKIDVYSGPSLFKDTRLTQPGFTLVELFGGGSPAYAKLEYRPTCDCVAREGRIDLMREGRVLHDLTRACAQIPREEQKMRLLPIVECTAAIVGWAHEDANPQFSRLFALAWKSIGDDLQSLARREMIFRPPQMHQRWQDLLNIADAVGKGPGLRLVSCNDVDYWRQAMADEASEAACYERSIRAFRGRKSRILVLDAYTLRVKDIRDHAFRVIKWMLDGGIDVRVFSDADVTERDFGIIGDIAVSEFIGRGRAPGRALKQSFAGAKLEEYRGYWDELVTAPGAWTAMDEHGRPRTEEDFVTWANWRSGTPSVG